MRRARGLTLVETMVGASVALLVCGALYAMLGSAFRLFVQGSTRSELQLTASLALGRLLQDLETTGPAGVSWRPDGLGAIPLRGVTADGRPTWEERMTLWFREASSRRLLRRVSEELEFDPTSPLKLDPSRLGELFLEPQGAQVMGRDVEEFVVSRPASTLHVKLVLTRPTSAGRVARFEIGRDIFLRNP